VIDKTKMKIHHKVLIVPNSNVQELMEYAIENNFDQMSFVRDSDSSWTLSAPLSEENQFAFTWLSHRMKVKKDAEEKAKVVVPAQDEFVDDGPWLA